MDNTLEIQLLRERIQLLEILVRELQSRPVYIPYPIQPSYPPYPYLPDISPYRVTCGIMT